MWYCVSVVCVFVCVAVWHRHGGAYCVPVSISKDGRHSRCHFNPSPVLPGNVAVLSLWAFSDLVLTEWSWIQFISNNIYVDAQAEKGFFNSYSQLSDTCPSWLLKTYSPPSPSTTKQSSCGINK